MATELGMLAAFLTVAPLPRLLERGWPSLIGWAMALLAVPALLLADASAKRFARRRRGRRSAAGGPTNRP